MGQGGADYEAMYRAKQKAGPRRRRRKADPKNREPRLPERWDVGDRCLAFGHPAFTHVIPGTRGTVRAILSESKFHQSLSVEFDGDPGGPRTLNGSQIELPEEAAG